MKLIKRTLSSLICTTVIFSSIANVSAASTSLNYSSSDNLDIENEVVAEFKENTSVVNEYTEITDTESFEYIEVAAENETIDDILPELEPEQSGILSDNDTIKCEEYNGHKYYLTDGKLYKNEILEENQLFSEYYIENIFIVDDRLLASVLDDEISTFDVELEECTLELFSSNEQTVYNFLISTMGLNSAAACGVLSNIRSESSFNPNALGDNGTSYGICQWHNSRWTNLKNYCSQYGYNSTTLTGQLNFLQYELQHSYPKVWNYLHSVSNNADGAYNAAYYWCYYYEIPANRETVAVNRGNYAKNTYWPKYGCNNPEGCIDSVTGGSGSVTVSGWAFDRDQPGTSIPIHIYIGGAAGDSNAVGYAITANAYRDDVNNAYGTGNYHGFSAQINTDKTGTQPVYIYACNVGGGENVLLGSRTVTISPRTTYLDVWVSESKMGNKVVTCETGKQYYLCFKIYDGATGELYNSYANSNYTSTEYVYDASGKEFFSYQYGKSDNNWISFVPNSSGTWTGKVNISGDISGELSVTFNVIQRTSTLDSWISKTDMGSKITECDLGGSYYLCYKMYDTNSGDLFNSYSNYSYTVKIVFYDKNNTEIGTCEFSNKDTASVQFTTVEAGTCSYRIIISGDVTCDVTDSFTIKEKKIAVTGVKLNKSSTSLKVGNTETLTATVSPTNATNKSILWTSSNTNVATVSNGVVTAKTPGTTTITATTSDGSKKATCVVTVTQPVTGVGLNKSSTTLKVGATETLTATVLPSNATNKTVSWKSSNTSVATVSNGVVTAKAVGTATITAVTADGSKTATCSVTVAASTVAVTSVSINKTSTTLDIGKTETLTATVLPSNATNKTVSWTSSDTSVASVLNGVITAKAAGTATITVKTADGSKTATCTVKVNSPVDENAPKVQVKNVIGKAGNTVDVVLKVENNPGIAVLGFKIGYDSSAMTLQSVTSNDIFTSSDITAGDISKNPYTFSAMNASANIKTNGNLVTLTFKIKDTCDNGTYAITLTEPEAYNINEQIIAFTLVNGTVTIKDVEPGDITGDGSINRLDLLRLGKYLADWDVEISEAASDVTGDGTVNRLDLLRLGKYLADWDVVLGQ